MFSVRVIVQLHAAFISMLMSPNHAMMPERARVHTEILCDKAYGAMSGERYVAGAIKRCAKTYSRTMKEKPVPLWRV